MKSRYTKKQLEYLTVRCRSLAIPDLTRAFNKRFGQSRTECAIKSALTDRKIKSGRKSGGHKSFYTKKHIKFLTLKYKSMMIADLTRAFNKRFGMDKTERAIKSALTNRRITSGRKCGSIPGTRLSLTKKQIRFLKKYYPKYTIRVLTIKLNEKFGTRKTPQQLKTFVQNHCIKSGRTGCFEKGIRPWNTGTKGLCHGSCTSFKKGHIPASVKPLGYIRKDKRSDPTKGNYLHIKVNEQNPYTGFSTCFKLKHVVVWEKEHGPVPAGKILVFKDGNTDNCDIENLMLITRAEHLRLNKYRYKQTPAELKPSVAALAKLEVKTFGLMKNAERRT